MIQVYCLIYGLSTYFLIYFTVICTVKTVRITRIFVVISYKSLFIEWCQKNKHQFKFSVYEDTGNDTLKHFGVKLTLDNKLVGKARATSKKKAEEQAAKRAYYKLQEVIDGFSKKS